LPVLGTKDPLELLGCDDGHHSETPVLLGLLEIGPDMIELAVVETSAVGLFQLQDRDLVFSCEGLDLPTESVPDLFEQHG
jgi:hypothetical protein